ncbi:MAG TPA: thioredoxin-disulfide reductase [Spirochaetota bacterium]|nr:thioredoxin-disulfide reductase [Spirochaetota bacterium]
METKVFDLIIIGGGPAGLTAGIYAVRAGLDTQLLEKLSPGGQVINSYEIENYPGFAEPVPGWRLMAGMEDQARRLGLPIESAEVTALSKNGGIFNIESTGGSYAARSVIIASGAESRKLGVPGEKEFLGRGVSYCATCDGAFFKDKITAVVGGGDVALEEAHFLTRFSSRVYLVHRRDSFRGADILQKRVLGDEKIVPVLSSVVESINGEDKVNSVAVKDVKTGETRNLETDGVFIFVGYDPITSYLDNSLLNEKGEVIVDMDMKTGIDGLFAAGDLRSGSKRQIVMAAADGATASMGAYEYLSVISCT